MSIVFVDTCVLIEILKGKAKLDDSKQFALNAIIEIELLQGARDKKEQMAIIKFLSKFKSIEITNDIFDLSKFLIIKYALSHRLKLADAVIAATCLVYDLPLLTYNVKDFGYIEDLKLERG